VVVHDYDGASIAGFDEENPNMRETPNCLLIILLAGVFAFAGCGKSDKSAAQRVPATIDMPKFWQAFASATPDQQDCVAKVDHGVRYNLYPEALAALDKLAGDATLTDLQKQAVTNLSWGIKQALAKSAASPSQ
jgi:hypothetical protein